MQCRRRAEVAEWMQSFKIHENLSRLQEVSQVREGDYLRAYTFRACPDVQQAQGCSVSFSEEESQQLRGLIRRLDELGEVAC